MREGKCVRERGREQGMETCEREREKKNDGGVCVRDRGVREKREAARA